MTTNTLRNILGLFALTLLLFTIISCNNTNKIATKTSSSLIPKDEVIPDAVVQFLITSAADDFRTHQPPLPINFRNVKIGYSASADTKTYVLCGEFLSSKKNAEWESFATIKTSGYEQYIGNQARPFCQEANMILTDDSLSVVLENKLAK